MFSNGPLNLDDLGHDQVGQKENGEGKYCEEREVYLVTNRFVF